MPKSSLANPSASANNLSASIYIREAASPSFSVDRILTVFVREISFHHDVGFDLLGYAWTEEHEMAREGSSEPASLCYVLLVRPFAGDQGQTGHDSSWTPGWSCLSVARNQHPWRTEAIGDTGHFIPDLPQVCHHWRWRQLSFKAWGKHSSLGLSLSASINPFSSVRLMSYVQVFPKWHGLPGVCDQSHCQTAHGGSRPCLGNLHKDKAHQTWMQHGPPSVPAVVSKGKEFQWHPWKEKKLWAINCSLKSRRFVQE